MVEPHSIHQQFWEKRECEGEDGVSTASSSTSHTQEYTFLIDPEWTYPTLHLDTELLLLSHIQAAYIPILQCYVSHNSVIVDFAYL